MHQLFRLGKLAGLQGDRSLAFKDQIGDIVRSTRDHLIHEQLVGLGLFRKQSGLCGHGDERANSAYALDPGLFIDMDGSFSIDVRQGEEPPEVTPVFRQNSYFDCINYRQFFADVLEEGHVSMIDKIIEVGILTFGTETSFAERDKVTKYNAYTQDKAELFVQKAKEIVAKKTIDLISVMVGKKMLVLCPECHSEARQKQIGGVKSLMIYPPDIFKNRGDMVDVCGMCENTRLIFSQKLKTIIDRDRIMDFKSPRYEMISVPGDDQFVPVDLTSLKEEQK
jgi:hypothetical protein